VRAPRRKSKAKHPRRTKENPSAWALYEAFHGDEPKELIHAHASAIPRKVWALGEVVAIVYKRPGERVPYEHVFHKPHPLLVSDRDGKRLFLVGGGYRVKHVGIVR
jgi:hypothetical protein